ncbi:MAG: phosphopantothenoylcysteine decarboxylase [Candidatus Omnitrophota bacterium]
MNHSQYSLPHNRKKLHLLITAGPTREPIDAVRFISNYSTGILGYTLAKEAKRKGYKVTLVSGPTCLRPPQGVKFVRVNTAFEMYEAVSKIFPYCDGLIMTAAVCDFQPAKVFKGKIKKEKNKQLILKLKKTPDILYEMGKRKKEKILIGFSLEAKSLLEHARKKLREKNLDLLIAQDLKKNPFGQSKVSPLFIYRNGIKKRVASCTKSKLAKIILNEINTLTFNKLSDKLSQK